MPFTLETLDFLSLNRAMNSREWFHAHRAEYESLVIAPLAELTLALAPALADIDPAIVCDPRVGKSISRIWRDTRRGPDLPIYRDVMWCIFLREKYVALPGFWFEFSPRALRWGCGWYQTPPEVMDAARTLIKENGPAWQNAKKAALARPDFALEDTRYKRTRHPDAPEYERAWLDQRSLCLTHEEGGIDALFSPALAQQVADGFRAMSPVYGFFISAWSRVPRERLQR